MKKRILYFLLALFPAFSCAGELPDFGVILKESIPLKLSHDLGAKHQKELQQIISRHDVLKEGVTTGSCCWGGIAARFVIKQKGKWYLLTMMSSCPPSHPYTFRLSDLDGAAMNDKGELIEKMKPDLRIFENKNLYKELFQVWKNLPQTKERYKPGALEALEAEWKALDEANEETEKNAKNETIGKS